MSRAPHLTRKLVLQAPVRVPDAAGGWEQSWETLGEVWAEISGGSGRERADGGATRSETAYRVTLRAAPEGAPSRPKAEQRFLEGARALTIRAIVDAHPGARYLTCYCVEEVLS